MRSDVESQLRALGRQLEREVAHVDADEVLDATTVVELVAATRDGVHPRRRRARRVPPTGERHRWWFLMAAVAAAILVALLVPRPDERPPPAPPAATTTSSPPLPPRTASARHGVRQFPGAGPLAPGEHRWVVMPAMPTPFFFFTVSTPGWRSDGYEDVAEVGGRIEKGTPGTPDGAVIRFWRPDSVYAAPCGHILVPPSELGFAPAVAAIPGTELVSGPTGRSWVLGGHARGFTDELVVLRIPEDIACGPTQFYLWAAGDHVRTASARGSTITVSIIDPPDWLAGPPIFVDAETYEGASPELEQEVRQIIDSLRQEGGIG